MLTNILSVKLDRAKYLRQTLSITGCGSNRFDSDIAELNDIATLFQKQTGQHGSIRVPSTVAVGKPRSLDTECRMLTKKQFGMPDGLAVAVPRNYDPNGLLQRLMTEESGLFFSHDNWVAFTERIGSTEEFG